MERRREADIILARLDERTENMDKKVDKLCSVQEKYDERLRAVENKQSALHPIVTGITAIASGIALYLGSRK